MAEVDASTKIATADVLAVLNRLNPALYGAYSIVLEVSQLGYDDRVGFVRDLLVDVINEVAALKGQINDMVKA